MNKRHKWNGRIKAAVACIKCGCVREPVKGKAIYFLNDTVYHKAPPCMPTKDEWKKRTAFELSRELQNVLFVRPYDLQDIESKASRLVWKVQHEGIEPDKADSAVKLDAFSIINNLVQKIENLFTAQDEAKKFIKQV
jgi:hypothetical protein